MSTHDHDIISVVGGGWSFREVLHAAVPGVVIGCNDASIILQRPVNYVVSMDRLWTEHRWNDLREVRKPTYVRKTCLQNLDYDPLRDPFVHIFDCDSKATQFSTSLPKLNGTSTGMCALNLAYVLKPKKVLLFGFDMCRSPDGKPYWHPEYPWAPGGGTSTGKYDEWSKQFETAATQFREAGINVINVSAHSKITAFKRMTPKQLGLGLL